MSTFLDDLLIFCAQFCPHPTPSTNGSRLKIIWGKQKKGGEGATKKHSFGLSHFQLCKCVTTRVGQWWEQVTKVWNSLNPHHYKKKTCNLRLQSQTHMWFFHGSSIYCLPFSLCFSQDEAKASVLRCTCKADLFNTEESEPANGDEKFALLRCKLLPVICWKPDLHDMEVGIF